MVNIKFSGPNQHYLLIIKSNYFIVIKSNSYFYRTHVGLSPPRNLDPGYLHPGSKVERMNFTISFFGLSVVFPLVFASSGAFNFSMIPEFDTTNLESEFAFIIINDNSYRANAVPAPPPETSQKSVMSKAANSLVSTSVSPPSAKISFDTPGLIFSSPARTDPVASKKRKTFDPQEFLKMTPEEIIEFEVTNSMFKTPEKKEQFKQTLTLISLNNCELFNEDLPSFKEYFKYDYGRIKKAQEPLLVRYAIMFGSYNIMRDLDIRHPISEEILPYYNYLIATKPFDIVLRILSAWDNPRYAPGVFETLKQAIINRHPDLPDYYKYSFELLAAEYLNVNAFEKHLINPPETVEDFEDLTRYFMSYSLITELANFLCNLVKDRSWLYGHASTSKSVKFFYIRAMLFKDDSEGLFHLLGLDCDMIFYIGESVSNSNFSKYTSSLVYEALQFKSLNCLKALMLTFSELFTANHEKVPAPVKQIISHPFDEPFYQLFEEGGFGPEFIYDFYGSEMNLLQASFEFCNYTAFKYYISKVGNDRAREIIRSIWATDKAIIAILMRRFCKEFIDCAIELLGINPADLPMTYSNAGNHISRQNLIR